MLASLCPLLLYNSPLALQKAHVLSQLKGITK
jgi:hypothetical protein